jgi:hypothetical protein
MIRNEERLEQDSPSSARMHFVREVHGSLPLRKRHRSLPLPGTISAIAGLALLTVCFGLKILLLMIAVHAVLRFLEFGLTYPHRRDRRRLIYGELRFFENLAEERPRKERKKRRRRKSQREKIEDGHNYIRLPFDYSEMRMPLTRGV